MAKRESCDLIYNLNYRVTYYIYLKLHFRFISLLRFIKKLRKSFFQIKKIIINLKILSKILTIFDKIKIPLKITKIFFRNKIILNLFYYWLTF